jgi:ribosomal protein L37E
MSKMGAEYIRRKELGLCLRCGKPKEADVNSDICGSCGDDLRAEEDAMNEEARAIDEAKVINKHPKALYQGAKVVTPDELADQILQLLLKHRGEVIKLLYPNNKLAVLSADQSVELNKCPIHGTALQPSDCEACGYENMRRIGRLDMREANFQRIEEKL